MLGETVRNLRGGPVLLISVCALYVGFLAAYLCKYKRGWLPMGSLQGQLAVYTSGLKLIGLV